MVLDRQTEYHRYHRYFVNFRKFYVQKKARVYTEIVLSILATTFFLFFAIKPTLVTIAGLVKEIKDKKMVTEKLENKINALYSAQKEYLTINPDLYLVDQALPTDPHLSVLVKQLEVLAARAGVTIETIQFKEVALKGEGGQSTSPTVSFTLAAPGDYPKLKNLLQSLSTLRRIVLVDGFAFKMEKKETQELNLSLDAEAFFLKED